MQTTPLSHAITQLYQANQIGRDIPAMIAAAGPQDALEWAIDIWGTSPRNIFIVDVTEQWEQLSDRVRAHTKTMRMMGVAGVVDYDEDEGWRVINFLTAGR